MVRKDLFEQAMFECHLDDHNWLGEDKDEHSRRPEQQ